MAEVIEPREATRAVPASWPFLYSVVAGRGLVRNRPQVDQEAPQAPPRRRPRSSYIEGPSARSPRASLPSGF